MRIVFIPQKKLKDLETGDVFIYGNNVFMKIQKMTGYVGNAVNLKNGFLEYFPDDTEIEARTDAKIVL